MMPDKTKSFEDVMEELLSGVPDKYRRISRRSSYKTVPYNGPLLTSSSILCCSPNVDESLEAESFKYHAEHDRNPFRVMLMCAVQLGMEQYLRTFKKTTFSFDALRKLVPNDASPVLAEWIHKSIGRIEEDLNSIIRLKKTEDLDVDLIVSELENVAKTYHRNVDVKELILQAFEEGKKQGLVLLEDLQLPHIDRKIDNLQDCFQSVGVTGVKEVLEEIKRSIRV